MSALHPIVAVTGSSGAGTTSVRTAFARIFADAGVRAAWIEGDSYHRYDRVEMAREVAAAAAANRDLTHFGPDGNLFDELERLVRTYAATGAGRHRHYLHTQTDAEQHGGEPGSFTAWASLPADTDLLFYEGLHGALVTDIYDVARYVDLTIGVVPIINLEWIQKIHRDEAVRGYSKEAATDMILRRMPDYVHYICPQFSRTDINFQRVPTIDTSNPFTAGAIPTNDESLVVIHIANPPKIRPDYPALLESLTGSFQSRPDTLVVPASEHVTAMQLLLNPVIARLMERRDRARCAPSEQGRDSVKRDA